ncbi:MAG: aminotransferase class I/II-fold pyridoxal phosphate-dependent enzyme [Caulobacteraceae bacterium]
MNIDRVPILKSLVQYRDEGAVPFHMPGHKKGNIYKKAGIDILERSILSMDTTEVPGIDNLHCSEGAVKEAQEMAAKAFGAEHTFFLVNGTTSGIYSMILAAANPGDKIIIPRNCHRSVYGAVILGRLKPVYINPETDEKLGIAAGINLQSLEYILEKHNDAKAVVITNPTYYGICSDVKKIAELVHKKGMLLLVDEAHGSHFRFNKKLPVSALEAGADMAAQSIHKTLASMTQSSMLQVRSDKVDLEKLKFFLQLTQTASPSHILLASLDIARYIMEEEGEELLDKAIEWSNWARSEINIATDLYCLDRDRIGSCGIYDIDPTRITVNFRDISASGKEADHILRNRFKIQVEMSDLYNIIAITTIGDESKDYEKFVNALKRINAEAQHFEPAKADITFSREIPELALLPWEAAYREKEAVSAESSIGRICGEMIIPYPPGIPVLIPGEIITREIIDYIRLCVDNGIKINGASDINGRSVNVLK